MSWDGTERRQTQMALEQVKGNGHPINIPLVGLIVAGTIMVMFELGALLGHALLSGHLDAENRQAQAFREQLTCYIVKITQGTPGPDVLTDCGFLTVGRTR